MATPDEQRTYQREWIAKRRAAWFTDKECIRCGSQKDLRLDHRDPTTKVSHSVWSWSQARREAELAKCQILCEPCHQWKTKGCDEHAHVYSAEQVVEVRRLHAAGVVRGEIARLTGVHPSSVSDMTSRRTRATSPLTP